MDIYTLKKRFSIKASIHHIKQQAPNYGRGNIEKVDDIIESIKIIQCPQNISMESLLGANSNSLNSDEIYNDATLFIIDVKDFTKNQEVTVQDYIKTENGRYDIKKLVLVESIIFATTIRVKG